MLPCSLQYQLYRFGSSTTIVVLLVQIRCVDERQLNLPCKHMQRCVLNIPTSPSRSCPSITQSCGRHAGRLPMCPTIRKLNAHIKSCPYKACRSIPSLGLTSYSPKTASPSLSALLILFRACNRLGAAQGCHGA